MIYILKCNNKNIKNILDIVVVEVVSVIFLTGLSNIVVATIMNGVKQINRIIMEVAMVENLHWQN